MKKGFIYFDELPEWAKAIGLPNDIPIIEGTHQKDIDVDESALDKNIVDAMRSHLRSRHKQRGIKSDMSAPVGFDYADAERVSATIKWNDYDNRKASQ